MASLGQRNAHKRRVMLDRLYSGAVKSSTVRIKTPVTLIIHASLPQPHIAVSFPYWLQPRVNQTTATVQQRLGRKAGENSPPVCLSFIEVNIYCLSAFCTIIVHRFGSKCVCVWVFDWVCPCNCNPICVCVCKQEWSPSHNLKSLKKKQMAAREAIARQTVSDAEQSSVESSVIRSAL